MNLFSKISCLLVAAAAVSCSGNKKEENRFDDGFRRLSDNEKVAYVMQNATPDSVARFIVDAAVGRIDGVTIASLPEATLYAYEHYKSEQDLQTFSAAYDDYAASLPLKEKMTVMKLAGETDPQGIGYELGLQYVGHVRDGEMTVAQITEEIEEFRKACATDTMMFQRFITGFKVALEADRGIDLSEEIYNKFKDYK